MPPGPGACAAWLGLALVASPALFLVATVVQRELGVDVPGFGLLGGCFGYLDRHPLTQLWFSPVVFGLLPLVAAMLNVRAIVHADYSRERRLLTFVVEARWVNLLALLLAAGVLVVVFLHQLAETFWGQG
ncbi:MAG TPA: hypothetical protein VHN79_04375 [Lacunisphaera sp.]|nr:hypothetical protein [Lacunisphaera sp.]